MDHYTYRGKRVIIRPDADIFHSMRPSGKHARRIQEILNDTPRWEKGDDPIEEVRFQVPIVPMAVPVSDYPPTQRLWGIHQGHHWCHANKIGLTPFADLPIDDELLGWITIELKGTPNKPILDRAYSGLYTPPLPWMKRAVDAEWVRPTGEKLMGVRACEEYWRTHVVYSNKFQFIRRGTIASPPDWFTHAKAA